MSDSAATLIYIAGYGRSGSTLLDTMLNHHPDVLGCGEITWLFRYAQDPEQACSCGSVLTECPQWAAVFAAYHDRFPDLSFADAAAICLRTERLGGSNADQEQYLAIWETVFTALREASGKSIILDSSKISRLSYHRVKHFAAGSEERLRIIHLVRDPRSVMQSVGAGSNRHMEAGTHRVLAGGAYRGLLGWIFSNTMTDWGCRVLPDEQVHLLRYEALTETPTTTLAALGQFLGLDLSSIQNACEHQTPFDPGHGLSGNRMRRAGSIVFKPRTSQPVTLSTAGKLAAVTAKPWMKRYGYR